MYNKVLRTVPGMTDVSNYFTILWVDWDWPLGNTDGPIAGVFMLCD